MHNDDKPAAENCSSCRFFSPDNSLEIPSGECRRRAPAPLVFTRTDEQQVKWDASSAYHWDTFWPCVSGADWCGEWEE